MRPLTQGPIKKTNCERVAAYLLAWSRGRTEMEGFRAPLEYWKLILRIDCGALRRAATRVRNTNELQE